MPITLTTPVSLNTQKAISVGVLEIDSFNIDNEAKVIQIWASFNDSGTKYKVPGMLVIENVAEDGGRVYTWGSLELSAAQADHFDDWAATAPTVTSSYYAVIKEGLYAAIAGTFSELAGEVS